jgi:hypothetical protein
MSKLIHFEIPANDPEKIQKFYSAVFGWKTTEYDPGRYWMVEAGPEEEPGIHGAIMKRMDPQQPIGVYLNVADVDEAIKTIEQHGGKMVVPKSPVPSMGYFAFFTDPEGNIVGIWQSDSAVTG